VLHYSKIGRPFPRWVNFALRGTVFDGDVAALNVAKIVQAPPEVIPDRRVIDNANAWNPYTPLLRVRRERPCRRAVAAFAANAAGMPPVAITVT
jgi:hypothetical protein